MKKENKTTSKKVNQLKDELGEMLKQFEKIKIEKQVKAKKIATPTHKTKLKKEDSFLKDGFLTDDFFNKKNKSTKNKASKLSIDKKEESKQESKEVENDHFVDITFEDKAATKVDNSISELEVEIVELTSELSKLEKNILTNENVRKKTKKESKHSLDTVASNTDEKLSENQNESYLTIKQKLDKIKTEITKNNPEETAFINKALISDKVEQKNKVSIPIDNSITKEKTGVLKSQKTDQKIKFQKNNVDKLTIIILSLIIIVLGIVWFMLKN